MDCVAIAHEALLAVVRANADTLTELRMEGICDDEDDPLDVGHIEAVLGAAPRLRLLAADVYCGDVAVVHRLLRNEGVFAAMRVRKLRIGNVRDEAGVLALAADLAAHIWLTEVYLIGAPLGTLAVLDTVADAALALRLPSLALISCRITPASAPALARLLNGGALTELSVFNSHRQLLDQPAAALIADALRANSSLTSLKLRGCRLRYDAAASTLILGALTAHRSLRTLNLGFNAIRPGDQQAPALGAALGALVAADAPVLHDLHVSDLAFNEAGLLALGLLLDALPLNTHLRTLNLGQVLCTDEFARDRLLPAVRANTSLRHLSVQRKGAFNALFIHEAQALVAARNVAAAP
jgi:hypothetical protein